MTTATTFFAQLNLKLYSVSYEISFVNTRNNVYFMLHISSIGFFMKRRQSSRYAKYHVDVKETIILRVFRFRRKILLLFYCFFFRDFFRTLLLVNYATNLNGIFSTERTLKDLKVKKLRADDVTSGLRF